jgi:hypothetical protein
MFAIHLGTHLVSKYGHIHKAFVTVEKLRWARIPAASGAVAGREGHGHAFWRDGNDKWVVNVEVRPELFICLFRPLLRRSIVTGGWDQWKRQYRCYNHVWSS